MSEKFTIGNTVSEVNLAVARTASVSFTIVNPGGVSRTGRLILRPGAGVESDWLQLEGPSEREIDTGQSETVVVIVAVPDAVTSGEFEFHLECADPGDPQRTRGTGKPVKIKVAEPVIEEDEEEEEKPDEPNWRWLIAAISVVAVLGGLVAWTVFWDTRGRDIINEHLETRGERSEFAQAKMTITRTNDEDRTTARLRTRSMLRRETAEGALRVRLGRAENPKTVHFLVQESGGMPLCVRVKYEEESRKVDETEPAFRLDEGIPCTVLGIEAPSHYDYEFVEEDDQVSVVKATYEGTPPDGEYARERELWIRKLDGQKIREEALVVADPVDISTESDLEYDDDRLSSVTTRWHSVQEDGGTHPKGTVTLTFGEYEDRDISDDELEIPKED